jgi:Transposase family tnp2
LTILNLSLKIRYDNENILLLLLIPGPWKYKDLNTFLFPLIKELYILVDSVADVNNDFTKESFDLRAHLILVSANKPASTNTIGLKRLGNAIRPCYYCIIPRVKEANKEGKSHYYVLYKDIQDLANLLPRT